MARPITIVGGGLSGLTLGIALRQRGIPTTIWEAGHYPRHKVCGEFISGEGVKTLQRLGLSEKVFAAGARMAKTVSFFNSHKSSGEKKLPEEALCISRFLLDALLAREFQDSGGDLRENSRWTTPIDESVVRATGRTATPIVKGWRWFGLKIHARAMTLNSDLEMHFTPRGYVGLCRLPGDEINICGLFRSEKPVPDLHANWREWLGGTPGSILRGRLEHAICDEHSFSSVAALKIGRPVWAAGNEVRLGDSIAMIPPVTGNGMSLALESAELVVDPLERFSRGDQSWTKVQRKINELYHQRFGKRFQRAAFLQRLLSRRFTREALFFLASRENGLFQRLFAATR